MVEEEQEQERTEIAAPDGSQRSRCILVLGTGRSGTSAVGGVLYKLGVWMGDGFVQRDQTNPWGTFEDAELFYITRQMKSGIVKPETYKPQIERRNQRPLWGWKDPGLVWTLEHAMPYFEDVRAVVCHRPAGACIASARKAYNWGKAQAEGWFEAVFDQLDHWQTEFEMLGVPVLDVAFEQLMGNQKLAVRELAAFAYDGLDLEPTSKQVRSAERHIKR